MSVHSSVAKAVAEEGGINILAGLARSMNRLVAEEAAGGLWNLSVGEEHKVFSFTLLDYHVWYMLKYKYLMNEIFLRVLLLRLVE